ncbi:tripartite tricarboxylate transporter TctB family protein [Sediminibacillus halophilus]|uniref:Putative tricarboxylic transport membrane protein n=1 Tax=Sediminibacillus halophilus TaxID=482461 RepID=A0A1G9RZV6_9BACI|nr:tripartite tricarboxylate transporter TctB family protein [Sediminibacillus halophilus]SDM28818.1 putative tricarboxylic transport membrane protein [Sediminibacillus halophilus]
MMKGIKLGVPIFLIVFSGLFLISSLQLPKANMGNPNAPLYFPAGLSILMLLLSFVYLFQELKHVAEENKELRQLFSGRTPKLLVTTLGSGVIYALVFDQIGFLLSTILFLGGLLFFINGWKKWLINCIVAVSFSFLTWYAFSQLLGVSLP